MVSDSKIIVECNEDGFTEANLTAICDINKSSKQGASGYIGEKGIGFKSIFMSAYKVHIQSGFYSFSFTHEHGDSGLGMISPVWEESGEYLGDEITRMTLFLRKDGDEKVRQMRLDSIRAQFDDMQETLLLFVRNLRRINLESTDAGSASTRQTSHTLVRQSANRTLLKRRCCSTGSVVEATKYFHITEHEVADLEKNENRTYSPAEDQMRAYSRTTVVLAFPLDAESQPIIEPQNVFAFLPVKDFGLSVSGPSRSPSEHGWQLTRF